MLIVTRGDLNWRTECFIPYNIKMSTFILYQGLCMHCNKYVLLNNVVLARVYPKLLFAIFCWCMQHMNHNYNILSL